VTKELGTSLVLLWGGVAELTGGTESEYGTDETAELPGTTGAGLVCDGTNEPPGGAMYPLDESMELVPAEETE
jgi:hypothetical protein